MERVIYRCWGCIRRTIMKLLGTVELGTNNRMTLPTRAVESLRIKQGDILLLYDDKGALVIKKAPDED